MAKDKPPATAAVRVLREHGVAFTHHPYAYEERGGTSVSARELGVPEHAVIKTLVMEDETKRPLVVLMHGDREVSTKALARILGVKTVDDLRTCRRRPALGIPGRRHQPVRHAARDADLHGAWHRRSALLYVNGGSRGYLVGMTPADLIRVLQPILADIATAEGD